MAQQKFRPAQWARQDALVALGDGFENALQVTREQLAEALDAIDRRLTIYETAMVKLIEDAEAIVAVLQDAGLVEPVEDEVEDEADLELDEDEGPQHDSAEAYPELDQEYEVVGPGEGRPPEYGDDVASDEGMPEPETEDERAARVAAIRARRAGLTEEFRRANEASPDEIEAMQMSPEEQANSMQGVPDEGVTVREGRDPFTGEVTRG